MSFLALAKIDIEIESDGKKYKLGALSFKELAEYVLWYQYKDLEDAKVTTKDLPDDLRNKILEETFNKCKTKRYEYFENGEKKSGPLSWEIPEIQESMSTCEGIAQQFFLSARIHHPNITKQEISKIVNLANYKEILNKLYEVNGMGASEVETTSVGE